MENQIRIFILEDNAADAELMMREMQKGGLNFTAHVARDKDSFLGLLDTFVPSVVLADYSVPGYDGLTAMADARKRFPDVLVIIVSGVIGEEFAIETIKAGATDYVIKRNIKRLVFTINRALAEAAQIESEKRAREALRKNEQRFRAAIRSSGVMVWEMDRELRYTWAYNPPAGFKDKVILGKTDAELVPCGLENLKKQALESGKAVHGEVCYTAEDGRKTCLDVIAEPLHDDKGKMIGLIGATADITERKGQEEAILHAKEEWERTFASVPDLIAIIDDKHRIVRANLAMARRLGVSPEQCVGMHCYEAVHGTDAPPDFCPHVLTLADGREHTAEVHEDRLGGDFLVSTTPMFDPEGRMTGSVHIARDITERKRDEEKLARTARELERSNKDLELFAYAASHDLQEPLRMITSYLQLLKKRYGPRMEDNAGEFIDFAVDGAERMSNLIRDLLEYSRVDRKGRKPEPVNTNRTLASALANLSGVIRETDAAVTSDELPTVNADSSQLARLFQNLIGNAVKFRSPDRPCRVHIGAGRRGSEWLFTVSDNGIGIASEFYERVFVIFQRLHGRDEYPGTGIGLAICKKIVERHGGSIWVESEPGGGSSFYFTIPE